MTLLKRYGGCTDEGSGATAIYPTVWHVMQPLTEESGTVSAAASSRLVFVLYTLPAPYVVAYAGEKLNCKGAFRVSSHFLCTTQRFSAHCGITR